MSLFPLINPLPRLSILTQINLPAQRLELLGLGLHALFGLHRVRRPR